MTNAFFTIFVAKEQLFYLRLLLRRRMIFKKNLGGWNFRAKQQKKVKVVFLRLAQKITQRSAKNGKTEQQSTCFMSSCSIKSLLFHSASSVVAPGAFLLRMPPSHLNPCDLLRCHLTGKNRRLCLKHADICMYRSWIFQEACFYLP